ncbi:hypothetical protein BDM02DRAFT_2815848 [Thelephora ganbajun]|uniref:Uncharacterized protein n=1 Tax=Thelephora ganbajun TaxID=370292 RepID=A0ACB6ZCK0_THEGA|nr:hypothetical protein BDM02DRAFT_2815848 [Thelephora ganbajun]
MGATGSGKTSFINMASGSQFRVGKNLKSCTTEVQVADVFHIDGRPVVLIDTPGFDDTNLSDAVILERIAAFLAVTYENGSKLAGIIYLHRISDERFTGMSVRNFKMFRNLCGDSTLKNVIIVTNMWGKVEKDVGEAREQELAEIYFKPALDKGAQLVHHYNTAQSSYDIVRRIMKNDPAPLRIQQELVDEGKDIGHTAAGEAVNEEINALLKHHEVEMNALREEMRRALKEQDEETKKELEEETCRIRMQMEKMRMESEKMASKYSEERKRVEATMQQIREQARLERLGAHAEHVRQIEELKAELERNTSASAGEREAMLQRIHELECKLDSRPRGGRGGCIII